MTTRSAILLVCACKPLESVSSKSDKRTAASREIDSSTRFRVRQAKDTRNTSLRLESDTAVNDRQDYFRIPDLYRIDGKYVVRNDHEIGKLARLQCSLEVLLKLRVGRAPRKRTHSFFNRDLLLGYPTVRILVVERATCNRSVNSEQRVERSYWRVGTKSEDGT